MLDLAVIHTTFPGQLRLLFGDGQFGFSAPTIINLPNLPVALESHDVDADLDLDLLVLNKSGMNVALLRNDGAGVFAAPELHSVSLLPLDLALGDLDGDGLLDLAVSTDLGQVDVLLDAGAGVYGPFTGYAAGQPGEDGLAIASGDLDEDGDVDLAVATANSGAVVLINDGTGAFPTQSSFNPENDKFTDVVIADYDLDGHLDLAVSAEHLGFPIKPNFVSVLFGLGDGSFPVAEVTPLAERPSALTAHDLDGDGVLDLATTGSEDTVYVLINQHGPWSSLGEALAGTKGLPKQVGTGPLQPGSGFAFTLTDGPPAAFTYHVLGLSALNAPFKGGVLVPDIGLISPPLPTDSLGSASLTGHWPPGLSGLDVFTQFWHPDPAGVNGFAASNAVQASVP